MTTWRTEVRTDRGVFDELAPWWDQQQAPRELPFLRSSVLAAWEDGFDHPGSRRHVSILLREGAPVAALPLYRVGGRTRSMARDWPGAFDVVAVDDPEVRDVLPRWIARHPVLQLYRTRAESDIVAWARDRPSWLVQQVFEGWYIDLAGGRTAVDAAMSTEFARTIRRRRRRLDEAGSVAFHDYTPTSDRDPLLEAGLAMEAAGWKGAGGVAVLTNREAGAWFRAVVSTAVAEGSLRLGSLHLDDRLLAFRCDLVVGDRRHGILNAYDEDPAIARLSPGNLLLSHQVDVAIEEGMATYELGRGHDWKREWTSTSRPFFDLRIFGSGPVGRAAYRIRGRRGGLRADPSETGP